MTLIDEIVGKAERLQFTGYAAVSATTLIFYDYFLTFKNEGKLDLVRNVLAAVLIPFAFASTSHW